MSKVIERARAHYEVQEVAYGTVYSWRPETIVVECRCGKRETCKRLDLIGSVTVCECGANTARIREELVIEVLDEDDATLHPWHYAGDREDSRLLF